MKIDQELIKTLLQDIRDTADGMTWQCEHVTSQSPDDEKKKAYHLKLLVNMGLLEGRIAKYDYLDGGGQMKVIYVDLTKQGHLVLETMENDTLLEKIKKETLSVGSQAVRDLATNTTKLGFSVLAKGITSGVFQ